jgi:hypothetical protein
MQFPLIRNSLALDFFFDSYYDRQQIFDQCARIHSRDLKMDSYHGTRHPTPGGPSFRIRSPHGYVAAKPEL